MWMNFTIELNGVSKIYIVFAFLFLFFSNIFFKFQVVIDNLFSIEVIKFIPTKSGIQTNMLFYIREKSFYSRHLAVQGNYLVYKTLIACIYNTGVHTGGTKRTRSHLPLFKNRKKFRDFK